MKIQSPTVEWHILDESMDERLASTFAKAASEMPPTTPRRRFYAYLAAVALLLLLTGGWLWQRSQRNLDRITAEVHGVMDAEIWAVAHGEPRLAAELTADPSARKWHDQFEHEVSALAALQAAAHDTTSTADGKIGGDTGGDIDAEIVDLFDDKAVVQITTGSGNHDAQFRQVRFYKSTAEGWLHTAPEVEWWGEPRQLESTYFVFAFRKRDAGVVAEIAPQVDAMYAKMRRDFGLAGTMGEKPIIEISPTELPGAALLRPNPAGHFVVPSPAVYLAPDTVSDAELVLQALALQLSAAVIEEVVAQYQIIWVYDENILNALRLWVLWDLDLPLAEWHEEVVAWRLRALQPGNNMPLPDHYEELCAMHKIWLSSPNLISIPLTCTELDRAPLLSPSPESLSALRLEQLTARIFFEDLTLPNGVLWPSPSWATIILTTLVDYTVSSYGSEQLPLFLAGLGHYRYWPEFSSAVFDMSSSQLAADWYEHLVTHYTLAGPKEE